MSEGDESSKAIDAHAKVERTPVDAEVEQKNDTICPPATNSAQALCENAVNHDEVNELKSEKKECVGGVSAADEAASQSDNKNGDKETGREERKEESGQKEKGTVGEVPASNERESPVVQAKEIVAEEQKECKEGEANKSVASPPVDVKDEADPIASSSNAAAAASESTHTTNTTAAHTTPTTEAPQPSEECAASRSRDDFSPADQIYHVKWIDYFNTKTPIVTQNENGPCPMLAIMNVLLLRGQVDLPPEAEVVTGAQLLERLGDCILRLAPDNLADQLRTDYEQNVSDAVAMLPKLMTGLDVNVKFTGISDFEYTSECVVFDLIAIPLYHGWLIDPQQVQLAELIGRRGYNQLVEMIIELSTSPDPEKRTEAFLARTFLESSASQLTIHGLCELNQRLRDGELAVLFRNNHFSTLLKRKDELFSLVTDQGFLHEASVVWETLNGVDGDSHFVDAELHTAPPKTSPLPSSANLTAVSNADTKNDYLVALSLDQQERAASEIAARETPSPTKAIPEAQIDSDAELARQLQAEWNRTSPVERSPGASGRGTQQPQQQSSQPQPHPHQRQAQAGAAGGSPHRESKDKCNLL